MGPFEKIKDGFFEHLGTTVALVVTGLVGWLFTQIAPIILPAIQENLPSHILLAVLLLSLAVNIVLAVAVWRLSQKQDKLKLLYGILWDKSGNPYCPACKNPGLEYASWGYGKLGYRCNPCNEIFGLHDASGKDIKPEQAIGEL